MINQKAGYVTPGSWFPGPAEIKRRERNRDRWESKHGKQFWGMALELATNYMEGGKS